MRFQPGSELPGYCRSSLREAELRIDRRVSFWQPCSLVILFCPPNARNLCDARFHGRSSIGEYPEIRFIQFSPSCSAMISHQHPDLIKQREDHYARFLGPLDQQIKHSTDEKLVHVDIYTFIPTEERPFHTLITGGMSNQRQNIPNNWNISPRAELMLYCREPNPWMYSALKDLAEMPSDDDTFLSYRHTVPNGMPMTAEPSLLTGFFFAPPILETDDFSPMIVDGEDTDILLLVPITDDERQFAIDHGVDKLMDTFQEHLDPVIDEHRSCIISGAVSPGRITE
jgi:hypothetical protein